MNYATLVNHNKRHSLGVAGDSNDGSNMIRQQVQCPCLDWDQGRASLVFNSHPRSYDIEDVCGDSWSAYHVIGKSRGIRGVWCPQYFLLAG